MWVLGAGRKHFLEFLRNTSIQFFLMALIAITWGKFSSLYSGKNYGDAVLMGLITLFMSFLLYLAAHANLKSFFAEFKSGATPGLETYLKGISGGDLKVKNHATLTYLFKYGKAALAEACFLMIGFYFAMTVGLFYAVDSAKNFEVRQRADNCPSSAQVEQQHVR